MAATSIASHINNNELTANNSGIATKIVKKRGPKPLSEEVKAQRAEERLAQRNSNKQKKMSKILNLVIISYLQ